MVELKVIVVPTQPESAVLEDGTLSEVAGNRKLEGDSHGAHAVSGEEGEADERVKTPFTLPHFEPPRYYPLSSASTGSRDEACLNPDGSPGKGIKTINTAPLHPVDLTMRKLQVCVISTIF